MAEQNLNLKMIVSFPAIFSLIVFVIAYSFVMTEEFSSLKKSKPVVVAAGIIWLAVVITATSKMYLMTQLIIHLDMFF